MIFFMAWMTVVIFVPFFAPSLSVLAFGEAMCGIPWGVFQVSRSSSSRIRLTLNRHFRPPTPARLYQQFLGLSSQLTSACVGELVSYSRLVSLEQL